MELFHDTNTFSIYINSVIFTKQILNPTFITSVLNTSSEPKNCARKRELVLKQVISSGRELNDNALSFGAPAARLNFYCSVLTVTN